MNHRPRQSVPCRSGFALVAVLWTVLIAGIILMGVQKSSWANLSMAQNQLASVQAHWLARAGVEQALATLEDDQPGVDGADESWYYDQTAFGEVELETGWFSVLGNPGPNDDPREPRFGLTDLSARLNINTADDKQLALLPMLESQQVESIQDWIDSDENARSGGAEGGYYGRLRFPYNIRNGPLRTPRELLLVRGIDEETFFGEDDNLDGVLNANEDDLSRSWPPDDGDGRLKPGLGSLTTVYSYELNVDSDGQARIDMNSADKEKLTKELNFSDALATGLTQQRGNKLKTLFDLLNVKPASSGNPGSSGNSQSADSQGKLNQITMKWLADNWERLSVSGDQRLSGRININTANGDVLMTLPGMTREMADGILSRRSSSRGSFTSVGELLGSGGVTEDAFKSFADRCTVRSSVFEIHAVGVTPAGIRQEIVAVVDRGAKPMAILYWYQSE